MHNQPVNVVIYLYMYIHNHLHLSHLLIYSLKKKKGHNTTFTLIAVHMIRLEVFTGLDVIVNVANIGEYMERRCRCCRDIELYFLLYTFLTFFFLVYEMSHGNC